MNIEGFIWLEDIVEKLLRKHHVEEPEVEEVFNNAPYYRFVERAIEKEKMFTRYWDKPTVGVTSSFSSSTSRTGKPSLFQRVI